MWPLSLNLITPEPVLTEKYPSDPLLNQLLPIILSADPLCITIGWDPVFAEFTWNTSFKSEGVVIFIPILPRVFPLTTVLYNGDAVNPDADDHFEIYPDVPLPDISANCQDPAPAEFQTYVFLSPISYITNPSYLYGMAFLAVDPLATILESR
jgi:hypothetical protein